MKPYFLIALLIPALLFCKKGLTEDAPQAKITTQELTQKRVPLFVDRSENVLLEARFVLNEGTVPALNKVIVRLTDDSQVECLSQMTVKCAGTGTDSIFGTTSNISKTLKVEGTRSLKTGANVFRFSFNARREANLASRFFVSEVEFVFQSLPSVKLKPLAKFAYRPALTVRAKGQDRCDTYRIPGLVTTSKGTLIAVYDNRYNNSKDLQEDIDVGMSRSTDGGQTWEPMKVIMDMGEYGGKPQNQNGVGDPSVLYDPATGTLWVAAMWINGLSPGKVNWWDSKPGMSPQETGQFLLVKSTDDGLTWSAPINITSQIKDPAWQLLFQGPGKGIVLKNGTLVFPAQFKADIGTKAIDGGQYTCHSTIIYSHDHGQTWQIGSGAKPNTTEAQVVELPDGKLMLNMRDDQNRKEKGANNGRAVATTSDLGKTWTIHPTSNSALPEPNCMASLISAEAKVGGQKQQVLFFSNPNNVNTRTNMTIKASTDNGLSWPEKYWTELNETQGFGYSCMTMVDQNTIGIVYEGAKELYFQKVPLSDFQGISGQ